MQQHQTEQAEAMKAMATHLTLLSQTIATQAARSTHPRPLLHPQNASSLQAHQHATHQSMQLPTDTSCLYATPPELQGWLHPPPLRGTEQVVPTKENESFIGAVASTPIVPHTSTTVYRTLSKQGGSQTQASFPIAQTGPVQRHPIARARGPTGIENDSIQALFNHERKRPLSDDDDSDSSDYEGMGDLLDDPETSASEGEDSDDSDNSDLEAPAANAPVNPGAPRAPLLAPVLMSCSNRSVVMWCSRNSVNSHQCSAL